MTRIVPAVEPQRPVRADRDHVATTCDEATAVGELVVEPGAKKSGAKGKTT